MCFGRIIHGLGFSKTYRSLKLVRVQCCTVHVSHIRSRFPQLMATNMYLGECAPNDISTETQHYRARTAFPALNFLRICFQPTMSVNTRGVSASRGKGGSGQRLPLADMTGFRIADM